MRIASNPTVTPTATLAVTQPTVPPYLQHCARHTFQAPPVPSAWTQLDTPKALWGGAMLTSGATALTLSAWCPALSYWAIAAISSGSSAVLAAMQWGVAAQARKPAPQGLGPWPLYVQKRAQWETLETLQQQTHPTPEQVAGLATLRKNINSDCAAFLRSLGRLDTAQVTHEVLTYMRWHVRLDCRNPQRHDACAEELMSALEAMEKLGALELVHNPMHERRWVEARLGFVLHRGLLPQLVAGMPVVQAQPAWFTRPPLNLKTQHLQHFVDYWMRTPGMDHRFVETVLNPAWLR